VYSQDAAQCPLLPESDGIASRHRNDLKGH
jgi:hypothetical protein